MRSNSTSELFDRKQPVVQILVGSPWQIFHRYMLDIPRITLGTKF